MNENCNIKEDKNFIANVYRTLAASNHSYKERQNEDFYATDLKAAEFLLKIEDFSNVKTIWDNSVGEGNLIVPFEKAGFNVIATDLYARDFSKYGFRNTTGTTYYETGVDFLKLTQEDIKNKRWDFDTIVMNPPYKLAQEFVEHSMELLPEGGKLCAFLKIQFLEGKSRKKMYQKYPLKTVWVTSSRLNCAANNDFETYKSSAVCYAWFVWVKGFNGETVIKWFN